MMNLYTESGRKVARKVIKRAREILRTHGWRQLEYRNVSDPAECGPVCMLGAINRAETGWAAHTSRHTLYTSGLYDLLVKAAALRKSPGPIAFNDEPGRTLQDIDQLLSDVEEELVDVPA